MHVSRSKLIIIYIFFKIDADHYCCKRVYNNNYIGGHFRAYDHGPEGNQARYGQKVPLEYNMTKVTCPVHIFWGANDKVVAPGVRERELISFL